MQRPSMSMFTCKYWALCECVCACSEYERIMVVNRYYGKYCVSVRMCVHACECVYLRMSLTTVKVICVLFANQSAVI